jgi:malonyl CoA-acyl carrier protein transacylase
MKLIGKYDEGQIDLEGDAESLRRLAEEIRQLRDVFERPLNKPSSGSQAPDSGLAISLKIEVANDKVCVSRTKRQIVITGSNEKLKILAQNIQFAADNVDSNHQHIDYHPGHFYLDPHSVPLIITRSSSKEVNS